MRRCLVLVLLLIVNFSGIAFCKEIAEIKYTINGNELLIRKYNTELKAGDFIGRKMYDAKQSGMKVYDGKKARMMAALFTAPKDVFDCVYTENNSGGYLYMSKSDGVGAQVREIVVPSSTKVKTAWHKDGIKLFTGATWFMSFEMQYPDGSEYFSNFYITQRTDLKAIIAHYENYLKRSKWKIFGKREQKDEYICFARHAEKIYFLTVSRDKNGLFYINISG